ncbi:MAG: ketopantoate reductase family protein [Rhodococcus sp. (in: high G+C Gram-positive bacteria)]
MRSNTARKIAVVGAGAMGQLFGARLQIAGNDVAFVDTAPDTIEALVRDGITVVIDGRTEWTAARAGTAAEIDGPVDLIVVFTKGFHTAAALDSVRHLIGPDTVGLTLQNGLGNAEIVARYIGAAHTWMGTTDYPADLRRPGLIHTSSDGKVRVGAFSESPAPDAESLADLLQSAGFRAVAEADIRPAIWEKVAFNAALNTLSAVAGLTVGDIAASPECRAIVARVLDETISVATASGINLSRNRIEDAIANAYAHHGDHKTSMLTDRLAGRRTEVDFIGGAVVARGTELGLATPVLWTLNNLAAQPMSLRPSTSTPTPTGAHTRESVVPTTTSHVRDTTPTPTDREPAHDRF